jgi:hypothetical protein
MNCSEEVLSIAAMLSVQNVFHLPKGARTAAEAARRKVCGGFACLQYEPSQTRQFIHKASALMLC